MSKQIVAAMILGVLASVSSAHSIPGVKGERELFRIVHENDWDFLRVNILQAPPSRPPLYAMEACARSSGAARSEVVSFCGTWQELIDERSSWPAGIEPIFHALCDQGDPRDPNEPRARILRGNQVSAPSPYFWEYFDYACRDLGRFTQADLQTISQRATPEQRRDILVSLYWDLRNPQINTRVTEVLIRESGIRLFEYAEQFQRLLSEFHDPSFWDAPASVTRRVMGGLLTDLADIARSRPMRRPRVTPPQWRHPVAPH